MQNPMQPIGPSAAAGSDWSSSSSADTSSSTWSSVVPKSIDIIRWRSGFSGFGPRTLAMSKCAHGSNRWYRSIAAT